MTLWVLFRVQRTTAAAVLFSMVMHALVLVGLTQYGARTQADFTLNQPSVLPPMEVVLLTEPVVALKNMFTKVPREPAATSSLDRTRQVAASTKQQTQKPTPSLEIRPETGPVGDTAQVDRMGDNPLRIPMTTSKPTARTVEQSRDYNPATPASAKPAEETADQRSTQGARPDYAYNPQPDYPILLREQGVGGVVWLRVWVDSDGQPVEIKLAKGSGYRLLDDAALRAVKLWRFIPAKNGEQALASWVEFPIRFTLSA